MSTIAIPGVNSRFQTNETIAKLVEAESVRLERMKTELEGLGVQKTAWQDFNRSLGSLRTTARVFYGFDSPFNDRIASPSVDGFLTATASREAQEGSTRLEIVQLAGVDRFVSNELARDFQIPNGNYEFTIGDETVAMRYRGGSVRDFAENLSRRAPNLLRASVMQTRPGSNVLIVESTKPGADFPLVFGGDALKLGVDVGLIEKAKSALQQLIGTEEEKVLNPGGTLDLSIPASFKPENAMVLEFSYRTKTLAESDLPPAPTLPGPSLPPSPTTTLRDASISDISSSFTLPDVPPPTPPSPVVSDNYLTIKSSGNTHPQAPLNPSDEWKQVRIELKDLATNLEAISFANANTARTIEITNLRVRDPNARDEYVAKNPASSAQDAILKVEGVTLYRPSNTIDDVIPGVTLSLEAPTERPIQVKVDPDRESVKNKIIEFVAQYNAVQREINILSARKGTNDVITELDFLTDEEKEKAQEKLGLYQGDSTLLMIKSRMQTVSATAYQTRAGSSVAVLGHIGISTNASGTGGAALQSTNLRGYLEINEGVLDKALADNFLAVKDLFGRDSDSDLVVDTGIGFNIESYLRPYNQTGGIIIGRTNTLDTQIRNKEKDITEYEEYLVRYEADLKLRFGRMEGAINRLESSSQDINRLNNSQNN